MRSARFALAAALLVTGSAARATTPTIAAVPPPVPPVSQPDPLLQGLAEGAASPAPLSYNFSQRQPVPVGEGPLRVSVDNNTVSPRAGYALLRVTLENRADRADVATLRYQWRGQSSAFVQRVVEVPPGAHRVAWLPIPQGAGYGTFSATARGLSGPTEAGIHFTEPLQQAVLSLGSDDDFQSLVGRAPDTTVYTVMVRTIPPEEAPHELAAYVGFHAVVVPGSYEELGEPLRRALEAYAATGGHLVLATPPRSPQTFLPLLRGAPSLGDGAFDYGFGRVRLCPGFSPPGRCTTGLVHDLRRPPLPVVARESSGHGRHGYNTYGLPAEDVDPPLPESERFLLPQAAAPVGRFLLIILAFTLAIGPGSVWVARKKGPPMLLLSIPLTAFVTCALIVLWSVLVDGFRVHSAARGFTLLDAQHNRAITLGVQGWYANLAPGDVAYDTATALVAPRWPYDAAQVPSIDWTEGATISGQFVPSRTYREWGLVSVAPTRARLVARLSESGQTLVVENALGADVREVHVKVGERVWRLGAVEDGGRTEVGWAQSELMDDADFRPWASRFRPEVLAKVDRALGDGEFLALVDGPGFLPTGGVKPAWFDSGHVVRGEVAR